MILRKEFSFFTFSPYKFIQLKFNRGLANLCCSTLTKSIFVILLKKLNQIAGPFFFYFSLFLEHNLLLALQNPRTLSQQLYAFTVITYLGTPFIISHIDIYSLEWQSSFSSVINISKKLSFTYKKDK